MRKIALGNQNILRLMSTSELDLKADENDDLKTNPDSATNKVADLVLTRIR